MMSIVERIEHLKRLRAKWNAELDRVADSQLVSGFHLAEAIDDLETMIQRLEQEASLEFKSA